MFIFKGIGYAVCVQTYVYTVNYVYQMELQLSGSMLGYRGMQWRIQGGDRGDQPRLELVPILKTPSVRDRDRSPPPPPPPLGMWMTSHGQCPRGVCVLVNVFTPPPPSANPVSAPVGGRPVVGGGHELCCPGARPGSRRHWRNVAET